MLNLENKNKFQDSTSGCRIYWQWQHESQYTETGNRIVPVPDAIEFRNTKAGMKIGIQRRVII